jgi:hypothetical protein
MFTVLMGFAALGIDIGRFYSERRFIQDAVDAAALACVYNYGQGGDVVSAWNAADAVLQSRNLKANPLGIDSPYAARGSEVYAGGVVGDHNLISGILPVQTNGRGCRVAITVDVPTFLIKIVSPTLNTITMTTQGYVKTKTGFLPSVVQRWANQPGPGNGNPNQFIDHIMVEGQDYQCTSTNSALCTVASTATPGREFVLFGQSAKATNDSSFRGYIGLDIRDFTTVDGSGNLIHDAYNSVSPTASVNTLKAYEAAWINEGYPGPDICVVQPTNYAPCAQLAILNGSSSGIFVTDYNNRFQVGDKLLLQLYDGTVKTVPDFNISSGTLVINSNSTKNSSVSFTYSAQFQTSGATVTTSLIPDNGTLTTDGGGDAANNPFLNGCASNGTFSANPTPGGSSSYTQAWNNIVTTSCSRGIYQAWLRGQSSAPYTARVHETLVNINVDGQQKDYSLATSNVYDSIAAPGIQADYAINVTTAGSGPTQWTGNNLITLSWAKCPTSTSELILPPEVLVCGVDGNFAATSVAGVNPGQTHTFNVQTFLARPDEVYKGWVRATALDDITNKRVTHLIQVTLDSAVVAGGATQYADVIGYAVFQVTSFTSNEVYGKAITGSYADPNDPALAVGRKIGLVPWEEP